jgi:hypothetical protein
LKEAGFQAVQVIDTGKDLNAYAMLETQSGCCSPATKGCSNELPMIGSAEPSSIHRTIADLLSRYNVNDYAAGVQVYAVKVP